MYLFLFKNGDDFNRFLSQDVFKVLTSCVCKVCFLIFCTFAINRQLRGSSLIIFEEFAPYPRLLESKEGLINMHPCLNIIFEDFAPYLRLFHPPCLLDGQG